MILFFNLIKHMYHFVTAQEKQKHLTTQAICPPHYLSDTWSSIQTEEVFATPLPPTATSIIRIKGPKRVGSKTFCSTGCIEGHSPAYLNSHWATWVFRETGWVRKPGLSFRHLFNTLFRFPFNLYHHKLSKSLCLFLLSILLFLQFAAKLNARIKAGNRKYRGDTTAWSQFTRSYLIVIKIIALYLFATMPRETKKTRSNSAHKFLDNFM